MYTMSEIRRLQLDEEFRIDEGDKFCLVRPEGTEITTHIVNNQAKFCILQTINAYKEHIINKDKANFIINKIDAILYGIDMLGNKKVIEKLNKEIIGEELFTPHFNYLCVSCDDLYANFE